MWQILAHEALDLARERTEEARRNTLAAEARRANAEEARRHHLPATPGRLHAATARVLRMISGGLDAAAGAACEAARRLDGRTA